ncbi:Zn(II)2Cys6 transcription factor [Aspergillus stella-maris]|uniref:Zn(II)2Cys6 transcription factor n=1 Tax=Aspergillus stella-maris TaxID=1810926 RepID=UPI003CCE310D
MTDSVAADIIPPQPRPHRLSTGQQPRKLRDSCIHCANSKVKCNKEKPICSRCVRRRLDCEYKISRRTGRTSRTVNQPSLSGSLARIADDPTTSSAIQPACFSLTQPPAVSQAAQASSTSTQTPLLTPITTVPYHETSQDQCIPQTPDIWRSLLSPNAFTADVSDLTSLIPLPADVDDMFASVIPSPHFANSILDPMTGEDFTRSMSVPDLPVFPTPAVSDIKSTHTADTNSHHSGSCLTIILDVFRNLFPSTSMACRFPCGEQKTHIRTLETVVSENKQIIDTINDVLDCSCSHDGYMISIVSLAVFKVMSWYIAAAKGQMTSFREGMMWERDYVNQSESVGRSPFADQAPYTAAPIGGHYGNNDNPNRMAAQLVLSELHRVQRLVNVLALRLENMRLKSSLSSAAAFSSSGGNVDNSQFELMRASPLSGSTLSQLEEDLRKCLRAVSSETIDILRQA